MPLDDRLKEEQIVATVKTLDMANEIRNRLMRWGREPGNTRICVYVFFSSTMPDEYHVGIASEWQTKLPEDTVLDAMVMVSDFQEEQLLEEARAKSIFPPQIDTDSLLPATLDEYYGLPEPGPDDLDLPGDWDRER